jgi:hypothetical protein
MVEAREHLERYGWWINELEYNEFNDLDEIRDLAEIIKHDKYIDYNTASTTETPANNYFIT